MNDMPQAFMIQRVERETPTVKTFYFKAPELTKHAKPGQFLMVWIPEIDEVPVSISHFNDETIAVTVKQVGEASSALHRKGVGDLVGLRGPYGNGYHLHGKKILVVGGGVGIAPLRPLADHSNKELDFVIGAANKDEIFFKKYFKSLAICTDDGSFGRKCFVTQLADEEMAKTTYDQVVACGPEVMLKHLFALCEKRSVPVQFSMERWMKCGTGVCGHCSVSPTGWRVCKEGPIANEKVLRKNDEFFQFRRDQSGEEVPL